jgi:predicted transcriptional regulator
MKLSDVVNELSLEVKSPGNGIEKEISGVYVSDLLSDVMANSKEGNIWITLQTHMNVVAVASMKGLAGIIIVGGRKIPDDVLEKAESEKVTVMAASSPAFEVAGKLYELLS